MNDYRDFEFVTITQLGRIYGVSRVVMGKWLTKIGLRTSELDPSTEALQTGFCKLIRNDAEISFFAWHRQKTMQALSAGGYNPVSEEPATMLADALNGPFSLSKTSEDGYQIVNGDTTVCIWVRKEKNANTVLRLLNAAHERGWFGGKA